LSAGTLRFEEARTWSPSSSALPFGICVLVTPQESSFNRRWYQFTPIWGASSVAKRHVAPRTVLDTSVGAQVLGADPPYAENIATSPCPPISEEIGNQNLTVGDPFRLLQASGRRKSWATTATSKKKKKKKKKYWHVVRTACQDGSAAIRAPMKTSSASPEHKSRHTPKAGSTKSPSPRIPRRPRMNGVTGPRNHRDYNLSPPPQASHVA